MIFRSGKACYINAPVRTLFGSGGTRDDIESFEPAFRKRLETLNRIDAGIGSIVYIKSKNVPGDINEDGLVNAKDASYLLKYVADSANEDFDDQLMKSRCTEFGDISGDKKINATDASLILAYTAALADDPSISLSYFLSTVR